MLNKKKWHLDYLLMWIICAILVNKIMERIFFRLTTEYWFFFRLTTQYWFFFQIDNSVLISSTCENIQFIFVSQNSLSESSYSPFLNPCNCFLLPKNYLPSMVAIKDLLRTYRPADESVSLRLPVLFQGGETS